MDSDSCEETTNESGNRATSVRIRFILSNDSQPSTSDNEQTTQQQENSFKYSKGYEQQQVSNSHEQTKTKTNSKNKKKRPSLFKYIEPSHHKSSLFIDFGDRSNEKKNQLLTKNVYDEDENNANQLNLDTKEQNYHRERTHIFISPDLNQASDSTPTNPQPESPIVNTFQIPSLKPSIVEAVELDEELVIEIDQQDLPSKTMNSCNFLNWASAADTQHKPVRKSSGQEQANNKNQPPGGGTVKTGSSNTLNTIVNQSEQGRRASSSEAIDGQSTTASRRSASCNHLEALHVSNETLCGTVQNLAHYEALLELNQPDTFSIDDDDYINTTSEILHNDLDNLGLEEECKYLEEEAENLERRLDDLERKRFAEDVPRTLVENIIKLRKVERALEFQLYERTLESSNESSERQSCEKLSISSRQHDGHSPSGGGQFGIDSSNQIYLMNDVVALLRHSDLSDRLTAKSPSPTNHSPSKFGSRIKPGQENTADILNAVPPSGSLQHRQYMNDRFHRPSQQQHQQPPVRPNHFKGDLRSALSQDSSSTESSASPIQLDDLSEQPS